jgi:predicted tellurium resistance membrane protein TerC
MEWISDPTAWSALAALLTLEIVLGVDNVVFISILASKLPAEQQDKARKIGLIAAGGMRVLLLLAVGWVISLKEGTLLCWVSWVQWQRTCASCWWIVPDLQSNERNPSQT